MLNVEYLEKICKKIGNRNFYESGQSTPTFFKPSVIRANKKN